MTEQALTDEQIIKKHDASCRGRAYIELQIVNKLIETAAAKGYTLLVNEYEQDGETGYDVKSAIFNLDDARVFVIDGANGRIGWIRLVMGNSGYDVVCDYATNLEEFLAPVNALADWWGGPRV